MALAKPLNIHHVREPVFMHCFITSTRDQLPTVISYCSRMRSSFPAIIDHFCGNDVCGSKQHRTTRFSNTFSS